MSHHDPEPYQAPRRRWWGRLRAWWLRHVEPGCDVCRRHKLGVCEHCGTDWDAYWFNVKGW